MQRTRCFGALATFLGLVILSGHPAAQSADPVVGTWELNLAKSKFSPGPPPKSQTRTYVMAGAEIKATSKGVGADGKPTAEHWTVTDDGQDRPITGDPNADVQALTRIDAFTVEATLKKAGKVVQTARREISKDGKVMTLTFKGKNAKGQTINDVMVFDKR